MSTAGSVSSAPGSPTTRSIVTTSPTATFSWRPPARTIAYTAEPLSIGNDCPPRKRGAPKMTSVPDLCDHRRARQRKRLQDERSPGPTDRDLSGVRVRRVGLLVRYAPDAARLPDVLAVLDCASRSEERRVGKEW